MTKKFALILFAGAAAAAGGAILGWSVTATPAKSLATSLLASSPPAQIATVGEKEAAAPAPKPAEVAPVPAPAPAPANDPAPAPTPKVEKSAPAPSVVAPPDKETKVEPKRRAQTPPALPRIGEPGVFGLETPTTTVTLDPKRGSLRFKTPFGSLSLDGENRAARLDLSPVELGIEW
jgi:outer membrane biosynthesis protein TonB